MTLAQLTADMQARGLITFKLGTVSPPTTLPDNQGTFVRLDVPCIQQMLDGTERKTTQPVHVYNWGNTDPALPAERAIYADRTIENETAATVEESGLEVGRTQLRALIASGTALPSLGGEAIKKYRVMDAKDVGGENGIQLELTLSNDAKVLVWVTRTKAGALEFDPA